MGKKNEKNNNGCLIAAICAVIFFVLIAIFGGGDNTGKETAAVSTKEANETTEASNKENVTEEEKEEVKEEVKVKEYSTTLSSGYYVIGIDIPSGTYDLKVKSGNGNVSTDDFALNEIMGVNKDDMYIKEYKNLVLKNGVTLDIDSVTLELKSINASTEELEKRDQDLKSITLSSGNYVSGKDFTEGTYNIKAQKGNGNVSTDDFKLNAIIGTQSGEMYIKEYKNVVLKDNVTLTVSGCTIELEPSK